MTDPTLAQFERAWERAMMVWNRDDGKDYVRTVQRAEDLYFAGANLITELQSLRKRGWVE